MRIFAKPVNIMFALSLLTAAALPATAAHVTLTQHPLPKLNKAQVPEPVVPPPAGQIRWKPDGSDRFQYMQAYRQSMSACMREVFRPADPQMAGAAPDQEMTSDGQIAIAKCMAKTGMSAGPAIFLPSNPATARYHKAAGNMANHYMADTGAKSILNMTKKFDKIYGARKKAYMAKLAMANAAGAKYMAGHPAPGPAASGNDTPPIYVVSPDSSAGNTETPSTIQPPPDGQLWITPRSQ
ncbi:MAG TPA: hypothetical protein VL625_11380 [Patescibacteria group bacterium]|nr:hypothetical protein [Patescibacteria group bacterium]